MLDSLRQDVSYASRRLWQSPGFTLVAALTLALGIGATSAIFSIVNAVLLRPLPFPEADRLVEVAQVWKGKPAVYSPQNFLDVEAQAKSFERLAAIDTSGVTLTGNGAATRLEGAEVSAAFFDVLRARPVLGRGFVAGENEPGDQGRRARPPAVARPLRRRSRARGHARSRSTASRGRSWASHRPASATPKAPRSGCR